MLKTLSLAAALALLPAAAWAQDRTQDHEAPGAAEVCHAEVSHDADASSHDADEDEDDAPATMSVQQLEAAARALGEKMEAFGARAEAVCNDAGLDDAQKEQRIAALWREYEPDLNAFTAFAAQLGPRIAAEAVAEIDIEAVVEEAMVEVEDSGAMRGAMGVARNSAWTSGDPEHMATLGLVAEYAAGEAMDAMEEARAQDAAETPAPAAPATPPGDD
jgi:hypothetical protein